MTRLSTKSTRKSKQDTGGDKAPLHTYVTATKKYSPHSLALLFPPLDEDAFAGLCDDIKKNGQVHPIIVLDDQILDGWHRYQACLKTGVAPMIRQFDGDNPLAYVTSANVHRRHLSPEKKRDVIAALIKADPSKSDRAIGKMAKVHGKTVASVRAEQESRAEIPHVKTRTDAKGRQQPAKKSRPKKFEKIAGPQLKPGQTAAEFVSEQRQALAQPIAATDAAPAVARRAQHTVVNGTPTTVAPSHQHGSGSGSSTTSAAEIATRLLVDLIAHGVGADPVKVAQLLRKKLPKEPVEKLLRWFEQLGKAIAPADAAAS